MDNPFKKRATEYVPEAITLLPLVSPSPIEDFFSAEKSNLFDKLTIIVGTPGCGKTTIARVIEFDALAAISRDPSGINRELTDTLSKLKILEDLVPSILAYRLPMTTNFRSIWELPYSDQLKATLLRGFVQSKAVLGWFRQLERADVNIDELEIIFDEDSESAAAVMGAASAPDFREYARKVELSIFRVVTALIAPDEQTLASEFNSRYDVFEEIREIRINKWRVGSELHEAILKPMVIIDDAHELHPAQFILLKEWLKRRNIKIGRWVMCRPDVVSPEDYRDAVALEENENQFGTSAGRDYFLKLMQLSGKSRKNFRSIVRDIGSRYIQRIPEFAKRSYKSLDVMLDKDPVSLPPAQIKQLKQSVEKFAKESRLSPATISALKERIPEKTPEDESLAVLRILLQRASNRNPQISFLDEPHSQEEPQVETKSIRKSLVDGSKIRLMHEFNRPYYYGMDMLAEASNYNIEQFINLSGGLVDELLAKTIRGKKAELSPKSQHEALISQAHRIMDEWDFPYHSIVKILIHAIAARCKEKTLLLNAPLDEGANAIGIPQDEMDRVLERSERLTRVLHFAFAYKALVFVPQYKCKNKVWCLLELGAIPCIANGLRLNRGGFIEDSLTGLQSVIGE